MAWLSDCNSPVQRILICVQVGWLASLAAVEPETILINGLLTKLKDGNSQEELQIQPELWTHLHGSGTRVGFQCRTLLGPTLVNPCMQNEKLCTSGSRLGSNLDINWPTKSICTILQRSTPRMHPAIVYATPDRANQQNLAPYFLRLPTQPSIHIHQLQATNHKSKFISTFISSSRIDEAAR
jgi:hypothetical protein